MGPERTMPRPAAAGESQDCRCSLPGQHSELIDRVSGKGSRSLIIASGLTATTSYIAGNDSPLLPLQAR